MYNSLEVRGQAHGRVSNYTDGEQTPALQDCVLQWGLKFEPAQITMFQRYYSYPAHLFQFSFNGEKFTGMTQENKEFSWFMYENANNHLIWEKSNRFGEMHSHSMEWKFFFQNHHQIIKKDTRSKSELFFSFLLQSPVSKCQ